MTSTIQAPKFKTEKSSYKTIFAMGWDSAGAGSSFPTAVYKKTYIREEKSNHDQYYTSPL